MIFNNHQMLLGMSCSGRHAVEACGACGTAGKIVHFVDLETREGKRQLGMHTCKCEDNIKIDLNKIILRTVNYSLGTSGGLLWIHNEL